MGFIKFLQSRKFFFLSVCCSAGLAVSAVTLLLEMLLAPISLNCNPKKLIAVNHFGKPCIVEANYAELTDEKNIYQHRKQQTCTVAAVTVSRMVFVV